jgi:hypothetical protein
MAKNVIRVAPATKNDPIKVEYKAAAALKPGHILLVASGALKKHDAAGVTGATFVADVNFLDGVADAYAANDTVQAYQPVQGEVYQLRAKTGQALVKDVTPLTSDGAGRVKVGTPGTDEILCYAAETITTTVDDQLVLAKFI